MELFLLPQGMIRRRGRLLTATVVLWQEYTAFLTSMGIYCLFFFLLCLFFPNFAAVIQTVF